MISVIIRTINRKTLSNAINSAIREFEAENVIVIADAVDLNLSSLPEKVTYLRTGQKFDNYGTASINLGAYVCKTEFFCLLDDDDEFLVGAGKFMKDKIKSKPEIDIWIPGIVYTNMSKKNRPLVACISGKKGIEMGNIAVPTYRTKLLFKLPFCEFLTKKYPDYSDFIHVKECVRFGAKLDWYGAGLYSVRPKLKGTNGRGRL